MLKEPPHTEVKTNLKTIQVYLISGRDDDGNLHGVILHLTRETASKIGQISAFKHNGRLVYNEVSMKRFYRGEKSANALCARAMSGDAKAFNQLTELIEQSRVSISI